MTNTLRKMGLIIAIMIASCVICRPSEGAYERYVYSWGSKASNGLQLGIALSQKELGEKEGLIVHLAIRNTSRVEVVTPVPRGWPWMGIQFVVKGGHKTRAGANIGNDAPVRYGTNIGNILNPKEELMGLKPGEMIQGDVKIDDGLKGLQDIQNLGPGNYRIKANFSYDYITGFKYPTTFIGVSGDSGTVNFTIK